MLRRALGRGRLSAAEYEKRYNLNQLQRYESILNRHDLSLYGFSSILDFGCGSGRLTQYLSRLAPHAQVYGCDVDNDAVAECQHGSPSAHVSITNTMPPFGYDDGQFDLIMSYSVFTSLPEPNHIAWLRELARTLRPGGVMLHTTHSYEYLKRSTVFSPEALPKYRFPETVERFIQSGCDYYYALEDPEKPGYGLAIISKEYVTTQWPVCTGLTLLDYVEGAIESYPEGCQDIVMLVRGPLPDTVQ